MNATYTKLKSGEWGVRATSEVKPGDRLNVVKKSGEAKTEVVDRVVWTGGGVWLCATRQKSKLQFKCEECDEYVVSGSQCWETGCQH